MASSTYPHNDPTFANYTNEEARRYAIGRNAAYPDELYSTLLKYHESAGGQWQTVVDLGCGPGKATRDIAPFFESAIGIDHSKEMINVALSMNYMAKTSPIKFAVANERDFDTVLDLEPNSVDLITAAMAAHWFDMDDFWHKAALTLKPGGTVALWTAASMFCHPKTTPNAAGVQKILFHLENEILGPYELPGNRLSQGMYDDLRLPWQLQPPLEAFVQRDYRRYEWNRGGRLENGESKFLTGYTQSLADLETSLSTASMVTRWREAHPDLVGTESDCVKETIGRLKAATGGSDLDLGHGLVLLVFKKSIGSR